MCVVGDFPIKPANLKLDPPFLVSRCGGENTPAHCAVKVEELKSRLWQGSGSSPKFFSLQVKQCAIKNIKTTTIELSYRLGQFVSKI